MILGNRLVARLRVRSRIRDVASNLRLLCGARLTDELAAPRLAIEALRAATRQEAEALRSEIATLQSEISTLRADIDALRRTAGEDIAAAEARAHADIEQLRSEMRQAAEAQQSTLHANIDALRNEGEVKAAALAGRIEVFENRARGLGSALSGDYYRRQAPKESATQYWTRHNVTAHRLFSSVEESLNYLEYRNRQYPGYIELLPVSGKDGMAVLDYGCGPGHDLVGFAHYSRPSRLVGIDVSASSLAEAERRLALHEAKAELISLAEGCYELPFADQSFDYIHCSGVLMYVEDPLRLLREFHRLLRPGGSLRLMVYNYDSIWMHLYVAYVVRIQNGLYADVPLPVAFTRTTDGEDCPVNAVWRPSEMLALGSDAGFQTEFLGATVSLWELDLLAKRHLACMDAALPNESRAFLMELRFDEHGHPWHDGARAGIDGCYHFART